MFEHGLSSLVTYNPRHVSARTSLDELLVEFEQTAFHHWPVVDEDRRLIGIVSDKDVVRTAMERRSAALAVASGVSGPATLPMCEVGDVMSHRVITVDQDDCPNAVLSRMLENHIHSLPVVDDGRLLAIVTSTDYLREFSYGEFQVGMDPVSRHLTREVEEIDADATLDEAKLQMDEAGVHCAAAVQGECPLGVLTRRNLHKAKCRLSAAELLGHDAASLPSRVIHLIASAPALRPGDRMCQAVSIMLEYSIKALTVVNRANRLLGIISEDDVLTAMHAELA